jgi:hypothetical protein
MTKKTNALARINMTAAGNNDIRLNFLTSSACNCEAAFGFPDLEAVRNIKFAASSFATDA